MARRTVLKPRKTPTQERSRATVDAILQATTYVLVKAGWDALTTNTIAERAGVNIASLYQFFPNKESIVRELERRHVEETNARIAKVYARHRGESLQARVRTLIEAVLAAHSVAPELHRAFSEDLPREQRTKEKLSIQDSGLAELSRMNLPHPELAAWLIRNMVHTAIHQGVIERRGDAESGALVDELVILITRYMHRPARARRSRRRRSAALA